MNRMTLTEMCDEIKHRIQRGADFDALEMLSVLKRRIEKREEKIADLKNERLEIK